MSFVAHSNLHVCRSIRISRSFNDRRDQANNDASDLKRPEVSAIWFLLELFEQTLIEMLPSQVQGQEYALNECRDDFTAA